MPVLEVLHNRNVLLTGTTGFLGKVLLEKLLYAVPDIRLIYVLIRAKKGSKLNERFKREILDSPCFDRLKEKHGYDFDKFIDQKVRPMYLLPIICSEGDLLKQGLGLSPANLKELSQNCQFIMNCAASIDFNARLDDAININIRGTFRMMELAKKCQRLQAFTHVSTCYVNCNLRGRVRQEIYDKTEDPDVELRNLLAIPTQELIKRTDELLESYPNTYTFTKALCERLLQKHRGTLPLCIVRPAIINSSYREPCEGWVDSPAAASALYLYSGLGLVRQIFGRPNLVGDNIPCDIVVDFIIVSTVFHANKNQLEVYNVGSSDRNPIKWEECAQIVNSFWNSNQSSVKLGKASVIITPSEQEFRFNRLKRRLPAVVYNRLATMLGSKEHTKTSSKLLKSLDKGYQVQSIFRFFINNEWIFESQKVEHLKAFMNEAERKIFTVDVADIDIKRMVLLSNYGLQKYFLKENTEIPLPSSANLLQNNSNYVYFSDIKWARNGGKFKQRERTVQDYKNIVLKSARVQDAIQHELTGKSDSIDESTLRKKLQKEAEMIASEIFGEFRPSVLKFFAWALHKIFRSMYEKIYIDEEMLERLRKIEDQTNVPIVLAPTQKSYLDFLIVSYIFFVYKLKLPNVASDEVLLRTSIIPSLLRYSGGFFVKKEQYKKSKLYRSILIEYIEAILIEGNHLEVFLEGSRSRTGKISAPQLDILNIIVDSVMEERVKDVCIVPLTINYEKVLEGDTFPEELLGEEKVEESLLRVIKAAKLLRVNYGRVYIEFCEPIMLHNYVKDQITADFNPYKRREQRRELTQRLGTHIMNRLSERIVIMSTSVVSAVLLMNRKGVTEDFLINNVHWLTKQILSRGYRIGGINKSSPTVAVRNAIAHLENITVRTKKNVFELQISADEEYKKLLMLSYYRNSLTHVFLPEAFIGFAQVSFGSQLAYREGVELERLMEQTLFLSNILSNEYILPKGMKNEQDFHRTLKQMVERKIVDYVKSPQTEKTPKIVVDNRNDKVIHLYCSFLAPLVEAYWATMQYLLSSKYDNTEKNLQISVSKFEEYVQWHIESLYDEKVVDHYEACSLETLKNAINTYKAMGLLTIHEGKERKVEIVATEQRLVQLQNHLRKFIQNTKPISTPELLSRSIRSDLLLGSKL